MTWLLISLYDYDKNIIQATHQCTNVFDASTLNGLCYFSTQVQLFSESFTTMDVLTMFHDPLFMSVLFLTIHHYTSCSAHFWPAVKLVKQLGMFVESQNILLPTTFWIVSSGILYNIYERRKSVFKCCRKVWTGFRQTLFSLSRKTTRFNQQQHPTQHWRDAVHLQKCHLNGEQNI